MRKPDIEWIQALLLKMFNVNMSVPDQSVLFERQSVLSERPVRACSSKAWRADARRTSRESVALVAAGLFLSTAAPKAGSWRFYGVLPAVMKDDQGQLLVHCNVA